MSDRDFNFLSIVVYFRYIATLGLIFVDVIRSDDDGKESGSIFFSGAGNCQGS